MNESEKKYYEQTRQILNSGNMTSIRIRIRELKTTGSATLLPLVLELLDNNPAEDIIRDVLSMLSDLREQKCAPVIARFISEKSRSEIVSEIITSCWESRLDYSAHLDVFADCFLVGNYQTALESYTVIEEMVWRSDSKSITDCRKRLMDRISEVNEEKMPLFHELIRTLDIGRTRNSKDHPDTYLEE
jgi:hypothetical protein